MSTISGLLSSATWQGWTVSSASSVLGYESEGSDLLGADFLSAANADVVTLSAEAQAILDEQESGGLDLESAVENMSGSQVAALSLTVSAGEVVSSMLGDLDSFDQLLGLTV